MESPSMFRILLILSLICIISGQKCPLYWQQRGSICYRYSYTNLKSWTDAETWCQAQNAHLVKFENVNERNWMISRANRILVATNKTRTVRFWTGLNNLDPTTSTYTWADKSPVSALVTKGQYIYKSAANHCVKIDGNKLRNINCASKLGYICERHIGIPLTCNRDAGWQSFTNFCYKVYSRSRNNWSGAQKICDRQGGNLFTPGSDAEEQIVHDFSKTSHKNLWIGVKSYPQGNSYTWLSLPSNTTVSTAYWYRPPKLQRTQYNTSCVAVLYNRQSSDIAWQVSRCSTRRNFICKKAQGSCSPGWIAHQNRCYQFNTRYFLSWQQSMQFCRSQGGRMVESYGTTATNFLNSYLDELREAKIPSFWIGATDNNTNTFNWSIGAAIKYQNWVNNPPTNTANRQDCVYISTNDRRGKWRPTPNCGTKRAFVCTIAFNKPVQTVTTPRPRLKCDDHWILNSGQCFQFNDTRKNWPAAQQDCVKKGGYLATISSNRMHSFVINRIRNDQYWIGLNDRAQNRKFMWVQTNQQSKFYKWCPHEPNDQGPENCVEYANRCWNDKNCVTRLKYICQKPPQTIPTGPPVTTTPMPFSIKCGLGWEEDPSSHYCYQFHDDQLSWPDARLACRRMGGDLASIHSREEQVYINTRTKTMNSVSMWLGGTDRSKEGGWAWIDRTPFNYVNWAPAEPNDFRHNEDCMGYYVGRSYTWNDFPCNNRNGFICKKSYGHTTPVTPKPTPQVPSGKFLGCPPFWRKHGNYCWHFVKKNITGTDARTQCRQSGGELATVNSQDEQNFMRANLPRPIKGLYNGGSVFIGLSDRAVENYFVWDDLSPVLYTNWFAREPNNWRKLNEDCVGVWLQNGGWNDLTCSSPAQGYVCKKGVIVVDTTGANPLLKGCTSPFRGLGYGSSCYAFMDSQKMTWQNAQAVCKSKFSGQLATVNDRYVQSFLASYIDTRKDFFWIGLSDQKTPGTYSWVQGQTDFFTFWDNTHTGTETGTCVAMRTTHPIGLWENKQCTENHNFICETPRTGYTPAPVIVPSNVPCPSGWLMYTNYCYKKYPYSSQKLTWEQSRDFCRALGGDLLSIHDQNELNFVKTKLLTTYTAYWIGLNDRVNETGYVWSDGSGFEFSKWGPTEPNNYNNEDCTQIIGYPTTSKGNWNDNNCFLSLNYICKINRGVPLQTTMKPPTGATSSQCGANWLMYNNNCYMNSPKYGRNSSLSWYQARQYCMVNGGDLASIHTQDENNFLLSQTIGPDTNSSNLDHLLLYIQASKLYRWEFWIGLNELQNPGQYKWTDSTVLDFTSWNGNEPNDAFGGERCGALLSSNGNWNDDNCNEQMGFICKKRIGQSGPITPTPPIIVQGGCANNFVPEPYGNKCFYANNFTAPMTWNNAVTFCRKFGPGYDIAAINNEIEQAFVTSLVQGFTTNTWIGLNNQRHHRRFVWQDNSIFYYTNWNAGEPNGRSQYGRPGSESCVEMYVKNIVAGSWNDKPCNTPRNVICQGPKIPAQQTPSPRGSCARAGYVSHGTSCYKFVKTPVQSWQMAENFCQGDGGVLASINSIYENSFIESQMGPNFDYWIGLQYNKFGGNNYYAWKKSWPVTFTNWGSGEPSQGPLDNCVKSRNGLWDDTSCSLNMGYVCEINSAQPPAVTPAPAGHCRNPDETIRGDFCYYFSPLTYQSWPNARFTCNKRLMDLVSITSPDELSFVWTVMLNARDNKGQHTSRNIWIGLSKGTNSGFMWSDNTPFSYNNWNTGEPSDPMNATSEECVEMYRDNKKWNDVSCFQIKAFACKGRALLGSTPVPPSTLSTTQVPITFPNVPSVQPQSLPPVSQKVTVPTLPNVFPRTQGTRKPLVTFVQPTGFINGPQGPAARTRMLGNNKSGLNGGGLVGVIIAVVLVLGVISLIGILYWKKRNPSSGGGTSIGFDNALYSKGDEQVNISTNEADA